MQRHGFDIMTDTQPPTYTFSPIGFIESCFRTKNGTPRQAGISRSAPARLTISSPRLNNPGFSLDELAGFSHVWVLFVFHLDENAAESEGEVAATGMVKSKVAPPRLGGRKVGVFATRSPHRPAPIGLSLVRLVAVDGATITLEGIDLVDGTPVLDIKPYIPTFDQPPESQSGIPHTVQPVVPNWATPEAIYHNDLRVVFSSRAQRQLHSIYATARPEGSLLENPERLISVVSELLAGDPRSRYRRDRCSDRLYFIELDGLHITAWFDEDETDGGTEIAEVLRIRYQSPLLSREGAPTDERLVHSPDHQ